MEAAIGKMISRYGSPMKLVQNGMQFDIRAFLQETASRSEGGSQWDVMPLGEVPKGVYVYIGPVSPEALAGDDLLYREKTYQLRRTHLVAVGEEPLYCWGICVEKGGDGAWGE